MTRPRQEDGFVLVTVLIVMLVTLGLGLGLLLFTDTQQHSSASERARESAFNLAEAALSSQLFQLARQWPGTAATAYPASCTAATSTPSNGCADPGGLSNGYPSVPPIGCPAGAATDAWGSSPNTQWATYVRDDGSGTSDLFSSSIARNQPAYDANRNGKLWVRAVGVSQCAVQTVLVQVSQQLVPLTFPTGSLAANWLATSNNGNKVLLDTLGTAAQPGGVSTRCAAPAPVPCRSYRAGQVSPDTTNAPPTPATTLTGTQLAAVKAQAMANGTYFPAGSCPSTLGALSGAPTYIENCNLSFNGGTGNSASAPGWLVLAQGSLYLNGNAAYYGTVYAVNGQASSAALVETHGNSLIQGAVVVDGPGGVQLGESHANLTYDPTSFSNIKTYAGATPVPNTFRQLPGGQ